MGGVCRGRKGNVRGGRGRCDGRWRRGGGGEGGGGGGGRVGLVGREGEVGHL